MGPPSFFNGLHLFQNPNLVYKSNTPNFGLKNYDPNPHDSRIKSLS
jgi:hypothetical protein